MPSLLAVLAAIAVCAMHGHPVAWSSFPVLVLLVGLMMVLGKRVRYRPNGVDLQIIFVATGVAAAWSSFVVVIRFDDAHVIAYLGGAGSLVCGYLLGISVRHDGCSISRVVAGVAFGYSIHAIVLLSWFVQQSGWHLAEWVQLRWNLVAAEGAMLHGFGNLGNNAVLAATVLPAFVAMIVRGRKLSVRLMCAVAAALAMCVLLVTQSRGPLAVAVIITVLLLVALHARILLTAMIVGLIIAVQYPSVEGSEIEVNAISRVLQTLERLGDDASVAERREAIVEGLRLAGENPGIGVGVHRMSELLAFTSPHQWHLHQALEWGLITGVAAVVATASMLFSFAGALLDQWSGRLSRPDLVTCLSIPATYLLIASISGAQWHYGLASVWPALCGLAFGLACTADAARRSGGNRSLPPGATTMTNQ